VDNQLANKKTTRVLEAAFGVEWADEYMKRCAGPVACAVEEGAMCGCTGLDACLPGVRLHMLTM